jgi:hypothetical protein
VAPATTAHRQARPTRLQKARPSATLVLRFFCFVLRIRGANSRVSGWVKSSLHNFNLNGGVKKPSRGAATITEFEQMLQFNSSHYVSLFTFYKLFKLNLLQL